MTGTDGRHDDLLTFQLPRTDARQLERLLALGLLAEARTSGARPSAQAERLLRQLHNAARTHPSFVPETPTDAPATVDHGFASRAVSIEEVAAVLGCSVQYARRLARTGRLRAQRVGEHGPWLTTPAALDAYRYGRQEDTSGQPGPAQAEQGGEARTTRR
ncbi:hypothetical protein DF19_25120 [Streptomyces olindensis]|nr:hypothetical protein DF19_25120 [Streptomyces olindensis]